jgi:hypothetical protein
MSSCKPVVASEIANSRAAVASTVSMFVAGGVVTMIMRASIEIGSWYGAGKRAARRGWRESAARHGINSNPSGSGREGRHAG